MSGPLLDRIDVQIWVPAVSPEELAGEARGEGSAAVRARTARARAVQRRRLRGTGIHDNASMSAARTRELVGLDGPGAALLRQAMERLDLSARAYDRILRVARTLADLEDEVAVLPRHVAEAVSYRCLDRGGG